MAVKPKDTFSKFLNLCEPFLKKEKSMKLVELLQRRFIDCNEEYKLSDEFINLTEITGAKIESDSKHIFVHLRDYISKLKLHQTDDRKRKRQVTSADDHDAPSPKSFKGEITDMESDDHLHKMSKQSNVEHNFEGKTNIMEQTDLKSGTCIKEQCITIEDSDDEEDTQTNIELTSTAKKSQLNGNALDQSASYSKSQTKTNFSDDINHHNRSRPHSHKLRLSQTTKYQSQTHSAPLIQNVSHHRNSNLLSSEVNKKSPVKSNEINDQAEITPSVSKKQHDKVSMRGDRVTIVLIDDEDDELKDENKDNINLEVGDEEKDGFDASHSISLDTDQVDMKELEDMQVEYKETQDLDEKVIDLDEKVIDQDEKVIDLDENKQKDENIKDQEENKQKDEKVIDQDENKQKDENLDEKVSYQDENKQKDENLDDNIKDQEENKQKDENLDEKVSYQDENKQKDENLDDDIKDQEENKQKDENLDENVKDQEENKQKDENLDEKVSYQDENKQKDETLDDDIKDQEENKQKDENLDEKVSYQDENKQKDENLDENVKDQEENKQKDENLEEKVNNQDENKQKDENLDEKVSYQDENKQKDENLDEKVNNQDENKQKVENLDENVKDQEENKQKDENLEEKVNNQDENKQKVENLDGDVKKVPDKQNMENNDENDSFTSENQNITIDSSIQQSSIDINSTSSDEPIDDTDNGKTSKISSNKDTVAANRDEESKKDSCEDVEMVDDTQSDVTLHTDNECKIAHRSSEPEISDRTSEPEISKEDPETEVSELKMSTEDSEPKISAKDSEAEICKEDSEPEISGRASDNLKNLSHVNDNESGLKQSENIEKQTKGKDSAESTNIRSDSFEMDTDSREKHQWEEDNQPGTSSENRSCPAKKGDDEKLKDKRSSEREDDEEKAKIGSKKQIARLEKLLEDLRNKIEELKEKELSLDDMDDEYSSYIMEEKYQQKFVKVWNKLCELKQKSASTGRPSERRFKYSGTRYPEINRKIEKFINRRKQFPDYHDIHFIITKVSHDKKIGLGSSAVERLAREAFLDVGESLQKRRRQDLMCTSVGHFKMGERPSQDPALSDPELKKKLSSNRKLSKENMDQVLIKFSEKQFHVTEEEVEIVTDQSDDGEEEEEKQDDDDDVPELTTILEDRGSPVLENLQEKGRNRSKNRILIDDDDTFEDVPMDTDTFVIETDNAEHVDDIEVTIATGCRAKSEGDTDTFVIETDNAEIVDDSDVTIATGFSAKSEDNTSGDEQTFGNPVVLWENEEDDLNESIINNVTVCYLHGVNEEDSELSRNRITDLENAENICGVSLKEQDSKDNTESPVLYTAVKIDDIEVRNCSQNAENNTVKSTNKKAFRRLTGDDDLFAMSGVEEMSDSDDESHCGNEISNIIRKLDDPGQRSDGKIVSHAQVISQSSLEQAQNTNCSEKTLDGGTSRALENIDLIRTNILSQSAKDKIKNLLHLPGSIKNDKKEISNQDEISCSEVKELEKSNRISQQSAENEDEDEEKTCEKDLLTKSFILNSNVKRRARNVLSLKNAKIPRLTKLSASSDSESDMIIESPTSKDMTIDEQKTVDSASSYSKPLIESSPSKSVIEISEDFAISTEATIDSYIDSEDIMTLSLNGSSEESIDMVTGDAENKMSLDAFSKDSPEFVTEKTENELSLDRSSKDSPEFVTGKTRNELSPNRSSKDAIEIVTEKTENYLSPNRSSKDSIEILKEQIENEYDEELSGGNKDNRALHSINRSNSQKTDPFLTIVDVTSIGLDEYNSDSSDSFLKHVDHFEIKSKTSDETKSTGNKISGLFGKGEKISSFLSGSCTVKQKNNRSKRLRDIADSEDEEGPSECICIDDLTSSSKNKKNNSAENKCLNKEKQKSDVVQKTSSKITLSSSLSSNTDNSVNDDIEILGEDDFVTFDTEDDDIIVLSDSD